MKLSQKAWDHLKFRARQVAERAYCPYSKFKVGAVVVTSGNSAFDLLPTHYEGCNYENAAYGSTICAERNAVGTMIASGERDLKAVIIYTPTPHPVPPCGSCRQVINEFCPTAQIVSICDSDEVLETTLDKLLPDAFGPKNLA